MSEQIKSIVFEEIEMVLLNTFFVMKTICSKWYHKIKFCRSISLCSSRHNFRAIDFST